MLRLVVQSCATRHLVYAAVETDRNEKWASAFETLIVNLITMVVDEVQDNCTSIFRFLHIWDLHPERIYQQRPSFRARVPIGDWHIQPVLGLMLSPGLTTNSSTILTYTQNT